MIKNVTIRDVARHAGVSAAAVSYVLNGKNKVSAATKNKIMRSIDELNYLPDFTAISLSKKQSKLIGLLKIHNQKSLEPVFHSNLYYNEYISGVEHAARNFGYDILLGGISQADECRQWVKRRNLDGLIVMNATGCIADELAGILDIPCVFVDTYGEENSTSLTLNIDDEEGGYLASHYLISLGHQHIAMAVTSAIGSPIEEQRIKGYKRALEESGMVFTDNLIFESGDNRPESSFKIGTGLLKTSIPVTAVFAASDTLCFGIMKIFSSAGRALPRDLSIIGFDDLNISQYFSPSLTTIRQDIMAKGEKTSEMIFSAISGNPPASAKQVLPVELIIRESVVQVT
ncbi:LacI family DNA-binding transcriptional regulator [Metabacillus sp. 84]|uniref:LacI family DNA-binding transcriptional regulator n=1 Tax=Metabacillus sp. 84 TaxID=3404705 RepID=UPI003CE8A465